MHLVRTLLHLCETCSLFSTLKSIYESTYVTTCLTWKQQHSCQFSPSGPRSAAVTLAVSPPGKRSFQPAQKHSTRGAQY